MTNPNLFFSIPSALLLAAALSSAPASTGLAREAVDYVDPFIGTGSQGKTFPGADTPGGMVQLSPDTIMGGDNGSGYRYYHTTIQGFSLTHMSGVGWYGDLGNFLVMPTLGPLKTWWGETGKPGTGYLSPFHHETESAQAGYYAVTLADTQIRTELTATPRCGMFRFTFPENPAGRVQIDLARRVGGVSTHQTVQLAGDQAIEGSIECTPAGGGWGHGAGHVKYTMYYRAEFSRPLGDFGIWRAKLPEGSHSDLLQNPAFRKACENAEVVPNCRTAEGEHLGFYANFATHAGETILLKAGISFVSLEGARRNLAAEISGWDFDAVRSQARQSWAAALGRMSVTGGTEGQKTAFYTALYHAFLDPRIFSDTDGKYPGGDDQPHVASGYTKRTIFSGWDVYRSEFPLLTVIAPSVVDDVIHSFVDLAEQNGTHYYDRWELFNSYTGCMCGDPAVVVLNDAWQKGIRDYDAERAYAYAVNSRERDGNGERGYATGHYGLSTTLECANDDWNLSQLAAELGHKADAAKYGARAQAYTNLFDATLPWSYSGTDTNTHPDWRGWFRAKNEQGQWLPWQGLLSEKTVQEATVYQEGWAVPEDIDGLIALHGGKAVFIAKLEDFFERTPNAGKWNPYYNQPNEPVHLVPFLFNRAGAPWLTQKWVRIVDGTYQSGPEGLCGDEDVGQMSAWFVLAASGLHQACPGDPRYEIFSPLFDRVTFQLDRKFARGQTFTVIAHDNSPTNVYIQSAALNGQPINRCWLTQSEITAGGTLELTLGPRPNERWGLASR